MARKPLMAGNWKMNNTYCRGRGARAGPSPTASSKRLDRAPWMCVVCPPSVDLKPVNTRVRIRPISPFKSVRRTCTGSLRARSPARCRCRCSRMSAARILHRGPLRAPRATSARPTRMSTARRARCCDGGLYPVVVRRRVAGRARRGHRRRVRLRPGARRVRRPGARADAGKCRCGLRAHLGHRHGPHRHARAGRRTCAPPSAPRSPTCSAPRPPMRCACCTAAP